MDSSVIGTGQLFSRIQVPAQVLQFEARGLSIPFLLVSREMFIEHPLHVRKLDMVMSKRGLCCLAAHNLNSFLS